MTRPGPVLLPPAEAPRGRVSAWVPWISVLGVAVLGLVTLPATLERRRLDAVHAALREEIRRDEARLERLEHLERDAARSPYLRERALRALLHPTAPGR